MAGMQHITVRRGNIFRSTSQTLVNTVNCVGVMGAGLALECRLRYPAMFQRYAQLCSERKLDIGRLWLYKAADRWVLNFPTKRHWRYPSKPEYLHRGLQRFVETYAERGITSVAFPLLGAQNGGLAAEQSLEIMTSYLVECAIPVEIHEYDPAAPDDLYDRFKAAFAQLSDGEIRGRTGLRVDLVGRVRAALADSGIHQLAQLARVPGIGDRTLEKSFAFIMEKSGAPAGQTSSSQLGLGL